MELQDIVNVLIAASGALMGYVLNGVRQSVNALHQADTDLTNRLQHIEVLVAGNYVTREEYHRSLERLFAKLDSIDAKLAEKADK